MCSAKFLGSLQCLRGHRNWSQVPREMGKWEWFFMVFPPCVRGIEKLESQFRMQLVWCAFFCIKNNMVSNIRWHPFTEVWRQISPSSTAGNRKACFLGPGSQIFHDASTALALIIFDLFSDHVFLVTNQHADPKSSSSLYQDPSAQGLLGWSSQQKLPEFFDFASCLSERFLWPMKDRSGGFLWVHRFAGGRIWMVSTSWIWSPWRTRHYLGRVRNSGEAAQDHLSALDFLCWHFRRACEDHSTFPCWPMLKGEQKPPQGCSLGTQMLELPIFPSEMGPLLPCDCKTWEGNVHRTRFLNGGWTHNTRREPEVGFGSPWNFLQKCVNPGWPKKVLSNAG